MAAYAADGYLEGDRRLLRRARRRRPPGRARHAARRRRRADRRRARHRHVLPGRHAVRRGVPPRRGGVPDARRRHGGPRPGRRRRPGAGLHRAGPGCRQHRARAVQPRGDDPGAPDLRAAGLHAGARTATGSRCPDSRWSPICCRSQPGCPLRPADRGSASRSTTTRVTWPCPTSVPSESSATTSNRSSLPSTCTRSARTREDRPTGLARVCSSCTRVPTEVCSGRSAVGERRDGRGLAPGKQPRGGEHGQVAAAQGVGGVVRGDAAGQDGLEAALDRHGRLAYGPWTRPTAVSAGSLPRRGTRAVSPSGSSWSHRATAPSAGAGWWSRWCRADGPRGAASTAYDRDP